MKTFNVGILGATGAVGQKFIALLESHPWFTITELGASERSAGKKYSEAANWIEPSLCPENIGNMIVKECQAELFSNVDFVFSGLDSSVAGNVELEFAEAGIPVISNAKNFRMDDSVPLLIPEVNPDHARLIKTQKFHKDQKGFIVTNPNCVVVPLSMSLKPIYDVFGIEAMVVTSMQAVSGAGYPGVPSLDILGNVVPYISDEESKIETEPLKILGSLKESVVVDFAKFPVQATATRVPVLEGHMLTVTIKLAQHPDSLDDVKHALTSWINPLEELNLPTAPKRALHLFEDPRYPQPRKHAYLEGGMATSIGRLRLSNVFDVSFVTMAHNTVRGAAGGAILNAEYLVSQGYF